MNLGLNPSLLCIMKFQLQCNLSFNNVFFACFIEFQIYQHIKKVNDTLIIFIIYAKNTYRQIYKFILMNCLFYGCMKSLYFCCFLSELFLRLNTKPAVSFQI